MHNIHTEKLLLEILKSSQKAYDSFLSMIGFFNFYNSEKKFFYKPSIRQEFKYFRTYLHSNPPALLGSTYRHVSFTIIQMEEYCALTYAFFVNTEKTRRIFLYFTPWKFITKKLKNSHFNYFMVYIWKIFCFYVEK